jgi:hypothetical protein
VTSELDEGRAPRPELATRINPIVRDRLSAEPGSLANPTGPDHPGSVPARHLPIPGVAGAADVPPATPETRPSVPRDGEDRPAEATPKRHIPGAVAGVIDLTAEAGRSDTEVPGSVTKAAGQGFARGFVGKASNGAGPAADLRTRMQRFPELRGVTVSGGRASHFPDPGERGAAGGDQQPAPSGDHER